MTVTSLSLRGAGLETARSKPLVTGGEIIQIRFLLSDGHGTWIKLKAVVKRVEGNRIGIEFMGLHSHEQKCLGFYLMP